MSNLRVLIAGDHDILREKIARLLSPEFDIVGTASNGLEAVECAAALNPDVVILDISMPGMTGIEVARSIRSRGAAPMILFLSCHLEHVIINAALDCGASGFVSKLRAAEELIPAIRAISDGNSYRSTSMAIRATTSE